MQVSWFQILHYFTVNRHESSSYYSTNTLSIKKKSKELQVLSNSDRHSEESVSYGPAQKKSKDILTQSQPLPSVFPFVNHFFSLFCQLQQLFLDLKRRMQDC